MIKTVDAVHRNRNMLIVVLLVALGAILHPLSTTIKETRFARDALRRTPFHSVVVTSSVVSERGAVLAGEMVKRRCVYAGLSSYVLVGDKWQRAHIDTSAEDDRRPAGDRPDVHGSQLWGPWTIVWMPPPAPSRWAIYAHHVCPEGPQVNLFVEGAWP